MRRVGAFVLIVAGTVAIIVGEASVVPWGALVMVGFVAVAVGAIELFYREGPEWRRDRR